MCTCLQKHSSLLLFCRPPTSNSNSRKIHQMRGRHFLLDHLNWDVFVLLCRCTPFWSAILHSPTTTWLQRLSPTPPVSTESPWSAWRRACPSTLIRSVCYSRALTVWAAHVRTWSVVCIHHCFIRHSLSSWFWIFSTSENQESSLLCRWHPGVPENTQNEWQITKGVTSGQRRGIRWRWTQNTDKDGGGR